MNITKNKQTHRHREQTSVNSGVWGGGGADRSRGLRRINY